MSPALFIRCRKPMGNANEKRTYQNSSNASINQNSHNPRDFNVIVNQFKKMEVWQRFPLPTCHPTSHKHAEILPKTDSRQSSVEFKMIDEQKIIIIIIKVIPTLLRKSKITRWATDSRSFLSENSEEVQWLPQRNKV